MRRLHGKLSPRLTGLPYLADRATRLGGSPHLSCKRDQDKIRNYMDRRVTPPRRVTSPTWGPPPPCKQALSGEVLFTILIRGHSPNFLVSNIKANGVYVTKRNHTWLLGDMEFLLTSSTCYLTSERSEREI